MLHFRIEGPFDVEPLHEAGGRLIEKSAVEKFWADESKSHLTDAVGCYVFGFRASHGLRPVYVGQSKTGFKHECFEHHCLTHYNTALVKTRCGTPIMFFVVKDAGPTHAFESCIDRVENLLIQFALARNPELTNVQIADWAIQGVYRSPPGHPSEAATLFRKFLGIEFYGIGDTDDEEDETECKVEKQRSEAKAAAESILGRSMGHPPETATGGLEPDVFGSRTLEGQKINMQAITLSKQGKSFTAAEIAGAFELPLGRVNGHLYTLKKKGFLKHVERGYIVDFERVEL